AVTPSGNLAATATFTAHSLQLWDPIEGRFLRALPLPARATSNIAFSPDGTLMAVGTISGARVWNPHDWKSRDLVAAGNGIFRIAFSPDSKSLAGSTDR